MNIQDFLMAAACCCWLSLSPPLLLLAASLAVAATTCKNAAKSTSPPPAAFPSYANLTFWAYVSWRQKSACSRPVSPAASPSHDSRSTQSQDPPCVCHATLYAYAPMAESQRQPASRAARPVGQPANTGANEQASRQRHQPEPASRQPIINKRKTMKT